MAQSKAEKAAYMRELRSRPRYRIPELLEQRRKHIDRLSEIDAELREQLSALQGEVGDMAEQVDAALSEGRSNLKEGER
jgi:hypothetical protein